MKKVLVPLAQGCEELEAVTIIDILRRADIEVTTASLDDKPVRASRNTVLIADTTLDKAMAHEFDMIVLPGGLPGADHLRNDVRIIGLLQKMAKAGKYTAAICAAPMALAAAGLLTNKNATSYPGVLQKMKLPGVTISQEAVVNFA
jgi:protein deglycase